MYPIIDNIPKVNEISVSFGGYDHRMSCPEGFFYDAKNISLANVPFISSRLRRKQNRTYTKFLGSVSNTNDTYYVDNNKFYRNDTEVSLSVGISAASEKNIVKMGAYVVIFPDKVWYNTKDRTSGNIEASENLTDASIAKITFQQVDSKGSNITVNTTKPQNPTTNTYWEETKDGKSVLKVYSEQTSMWMNVATTYFKITAKDSSDNTINIGQKFKKGDGVKLSGDFTNVNWNRAKDIFVNDDGNGWRSNNFAIHEKGDDYIIVVGLLDRSSVIFDGGSAAGHYASIPFKIERKCPNMTYVVECQNRLWGCSNDGHELYCCKLGDPTNWNCFAGISTDSWSATVGSDGIFTGAYSYMGYPIFFKEESILKISISGYGAHSYRETVARGVQVGSHKSVVQVNELLYYKSPTSVCVYDGNFPQEIGIELGEIKYLNAVGGGWDNKYYISMEDEDEVSHLFVYEVNAGLWAKEDNTKVKEFYNTDNRLFFVSNNKSYVVEGETYDGNYTLESPVEWFVESGVIGYNKTDKLYLSKFNVRMRMGIGAYCKMFIEYDSSNRWEYLWEISGKGTKAFSIPVRPKRCDHLRYKIVGHGECTLITLAKEYEEGSDL